MAKRWDELSSRHQQELDDRAQAIVTEQAREGDLRIAKQMSERATQGLPAMTDGSLASYASWPRSADDTLVLPSNTFEEFETFNNGRLRLEQATPTSFFQIERVRTARTPLLELLAQYGLRGKHAECLLHHWLPSSYGVVTIVFANQEEGGGDQVLIGVLANRQNNAGTVSFPGGFVMPHESLETAAHRELKEEGGTELLVKFCSRSSTGLPYAAYEPHNVQPGNLTFVMAALAKNSAPLHPSAEWKGRLLRFVSAQLVYEAIVNSQTWKLEKELGMPVAIAPDVIKPAQPFFVQWKNGHLKIPVV